MVAVCAAALLNVFGQRQDTSRAAGAGAAMEVRAPHALRSGDLYQVRLTVTTTAGIDSPKILLGPGFLDGFTINAVTPDPSSQVSRDGRAVLAYERLDIGRTMDVFIEGQVNAGTAGRRAWGIDLDDGTRHLAGFHRTITVFP